jgi:oligopeptide transport system permease protein
VMLRYSAIRFVWVFIVLIMILSLNFTILKLAPAYPPASSDAKEFYYNKQVNDGYMTLRVVDDRETVSQFISGELDPCTDPKCDFTVRDGIYIIYEPIPIAQQYINWIARIITEWDWGLSTRVAVNRPAFEVLAERLPVTIRLNIFSLLLYIPVGFGLGIWAALKKNTRVDDAISLGVMLFISVPNFVVMTILVMVFGYQLGWFPAQFPSADNTGWIQVTSLVIPVLGLSFSAIAGLTRTTRAELSEVLTSEFVLLARSKGLTYKQSVLRHAMRNSMVPLVPNIIGSFVALLSGSVIVERIYSIPGTGRIYLRALELSNYDYNLILVTTAFYSFIGLFSVLLVDLSYGLVDPRIRMGARK